jgi:hypothetical protein
MTEETLQPERWRDPIVEEVRASREALFAASGYDIHELCKALRERQVASGHRVLRAPSRPKPEPAETTT